MPRAIRLSLALLLTTTTLLPAAAPVEGDVSAHLYIDRETQPFPRNLAAPRADRPFLTECTTPMILIGHLKMPRDRGGFYGADLREEPSFDGLPVEAPGYFRMLRAEDGIGMTRGHTGLLGHRDPFLLRGEFLRRTYKADKQPWERPRLEETRVFRAGSMERYPFVRVTALPGDYFRYLGGADLKLKIIIENPTPHPMPRITVTMHAQPQDSSFPLERRLDLERGWDYEFTQALDLSRRSRQTVFMRIPGKLNPVIYKEAERVALGGQRWPYPPITAAHGVHEARARAGEDLARLQPRRTLVVASGEIPRSCDQSPLAVRYRREFRSFGVVLDGLDLEILAGWSQRHARSFLRLLERRAHEVPDWIRPVVVAAMEAKQRRVPVVRRPGGFDEFDAIAMHLFGPVEDGATEFSSETRARFEGAWDVLYRHDGKVLPEGHREAMSRHVTGVRGRRRLKDYSLPRRPGTDHLPVPPEDHRLPEALRGNLDTSPHPGRWQGRRTPAKRSPAPRGQVALESTGLSRGDFDRKRTFETDRPRRWTPPPEPTPATQSPAPEPTRTPPPATTTPRVLEQPEPTPEVTERPTPTAEPTRGGDDLDELFGAGDTDTTPTPDAAPPPEPDPFAEFGSGDGNPGGDRGSDAGTGDGGSSDGGSSDPFADFGGDSGGSEDAAGASDADIEDAFDNF